MSKANDAPKNALVEGFVARLDQEELTSEFLKELVTALEEKYPNCAILEKLTETIDIELELERAETDFPWILFALNDTAYSISSRYVLSIEILGEITHIVDAPHYSPGITESRGEMIELVDMLALFGSGNYLQGKEDNKDAVSMMIVTEVNNVKRGIIVDEILAVEHITRFDENIMGDKENALTSQYISKIAKRDKSDEPVLILDMDYLATV